MFDEPRALAAGGLLVAGVVLLDDARLLLDYVKALAWPVVVAWLLFCGRGPWPPKIAKGVDRWTLVHPPAQRTA